MEKVSDILNRIKQKKEKGEKIDMEVGQIIVMFDPLVSMLASRYKNVKGTTIDDFLQEGRVAVWKAISSYDGSKSVLFETYVSHCINNAMLDFFRKQNSAANSVINSAIPLDEIHESDIEDLTNIDAERLVMSKQLISNIEKSLSDYENKVLDLYIEGNSYEKIANSLGKSIKNIDNTLQQIKKKIKNLL